MGIVERVKVVLGIEDRASRYTDLVSAAHYIAASGSAFRHQVIDAAANLTGLALSRAKVNVSGDMAQLWEPVLSDPVFTARLFKGVVRDGEVCYKIDVDQVSLLEAAAWEITGGADKWRYRLEFASPTANTKTKNEAAAGVLHCMYATDRGRPWRGVSPFEKSVLLAEAERGLLEYSRMPHTRLVPHLGGGPGNDQTSPNKDRTGRSRTQAENEDVLSRAGVFTTLMLSARGAMDTPGKTDLKFEPDQQAVALRKQLTDEAYEAIFYPPALRSPNAPGQAVAVAVATWIELFLQPLCNVVASQIGKALDVELNYDCAPLRIQRVPEQAQVVKALVAAGVATDTALELAGWMDGRGEP